MGRAFTILELFVVLVIVLIVVSIILPFLHVARHEARQQKCKSNIRQVYIATQCYVEIYDNTPSYNEILYPWEIDYWDIGHEVWVCPEDKNPVTVTGARCSYVYFGSENIWKYFSINHNGDLYQYKHLFADEWYYHFGKMHIIQSNGYLITEDSNE